MSNDHVEFQNPDNLPVEKLTVSVSNSGVVQQIQALDPFWVEKRDLIVYERPPDDPTVIGAVDAWKSKMEVYLDNLKWLLGLQHHRFWSTVLYHPHCMDMLVSFLQEARPPYIPPYDNKDVQKLYEEIRRLVFVVFCRLATNKESKSQWMSKEWMGEVVYNSFVWTVPVAWEVCAAYGADNARAVARALHAVFALQPRYERDVAHALAFVAEAFKYIILQVNKDYDSEEPPNLPETFKGFGEIRRPTDTKSTPETLTFPMLRDLVIHLLDTAMTLRIFAEVYPKSVHILKEKNFVLSIVQLYEYGIPHLYEKLEEMADQESGVSEVEGYLDMARAELIDLFREMLAVYKNNIISGEGGSVCGSVEAYLGAVLDALSERLFVRDYHAAYPVHDDLDLLRQAYPDIDTVKTDFILQAIYSNIDEPVPEHFINNTSNTEPLTNGHVETIENAAGPSTDNEIPDNIREESLISEVKDILPHLGDGFILKCLQHYGFNAERVINSVLEDTLAEPLRALDRNQPIIPEDILDNKFLETGVARLNVFDGDEFDIMTRDDVDLSRIHVGKKKSKYKDMNAMLDDKTEVKKRLDIYSKFKLVCEDAAMYSDEFDDTFESEPPPDPRRAPAAPRAPLAARHECEDSSEEETPEVNAEDKSSDSRNRMDFCVNPEEIRARREAHMQARGRGKGYRPPRNTDVAGRPRGQGQEKEVLQNRDKKEKHKSTRGNHNRRQGAQWKRSQGMMPS